MCATARLFVSSSRGRRAARWSNGKVGNDFRSLGSPCVQVCPERARKRSSGRGLSVCGSCSPRGFTSDLSGRQVGTSRRPGGGSVGSVQSHSPNGKIGEEMMCCGILDQYCSCGGGRVPSAGDGASSWASSRHTVDFARQNSPVGPRSRASAPPRFVLSHGPPGRRSVRRASVRFELRDFHASSRAIVRHFRATPHLTHFFTSSTRATIHLPE